MNETYTEILVKRETPGTLKAAKAAMIAFTVLLALAGILMYPVFLFGALIMGLVTYFVSPRFNVEYEYLYVNGDIDVDKIMNRQKRKRAASFDLEELEIAAPTGSHELDSYLNGGNTKIADYTSGGENVKSWTIICNHNGERKGAMLELDDFAVEELEEREELEALEEPEALELSLFLFGSCT